MRFSHHNLDVTPCTYVNRYQHSREVKCVHLQGPRSPRRVTHIKKRVSSIGKCNGGIEPVGGWQCTGGWSLRETRRKSVRTRMDEGMMWRGWTEVIEYMRDKWGCDCPCKGPYRDERQHKFRMQVAVKGAIMFQLCILARSFVHSFWEWMKGLHGCSKQGRPPCSCFWNGRKSQPLPDDAVCYQDLV